MKKSRGKKIEYSIARGLLSVTEELLFPRRCPVCDRPAPLFGERLCPACAGTLRVVSPPYCFICGRHIEDEKEEYCADCRKKGHIYKRGRALYEYRSVAPSLYRLKYGNRREYAEFYAESMAKRMGEEIRAFHADALIPVPLHKRRLAKRGYNQAELIARRLGARLSIPVETKLVERVRDTAPLKLLGGKERGEVLKNAFKIRKNGVKLKVYMESRNALCQQTLTS